MKYMNETQYVQKEQKMSMVSKVLWTIAILAIVVMIALYIIGRNVYQTL